MVEDDQRFVGPIEDALSSLGHAWLVATNQQEAEELLRRETFAYVLLDLEIPARASGGAHREFGANLLASVRRIKERERLPAIVMSQRDPDFIEIAGDLVRAGASDFIAKPFAAHGGRTLSSVVRRALAEHQRRQRRHDRETNEDRRADSRVPCATPAGPEYADTENAAPESAASAAQVDDETLFAPVMARQRVAARQRVVEVAPPRRFAGGELEFFADRVELDGVTIISDRGAGLSLMLLDELRQRDGRGCYVRRSAEELATALRTLGGIGAVTGCVATLRRNITARLRRHRHVDVAPDDVIVNDEQGYHLRDWIQTPATSVENVENVEKTGNTENADAGRATGEQRTCENPAREHTACEHSVYDRRQIAIPFAIPFPGRPREEHLNERQRWILDRLAAGRRLTRRDVEAQFDVHARTAKRDLSGLIDRRWIEFQRQGRGGEYRLVFRASTPSIPAPFRSCVP